MSSASKASGDQRATAGRPVLAPAPAGMAPAEWQARVDLAAALRLGALYGWHDLMATHFSARVPGHPAQFLVNPFGLLFEEITASSLVKIGLDGEVHDFNGYHCLPAADYIHGGVYAAREDVQSVFHLHSVAGVVVSSQAGGLLPLSQNALILRDRIRLYDYTGARVDRPESARMATALEGGTVLLLRNHGTLVVGRTVGEAFAWVVRAEKAFAIQLAAQASQVPLLPVDSAYADEAAELGLGLYRDGGSSPRASVEWAALLRKALRDCPGFDR